MEAVFTKNVRGLFSSPPVAKSFYCPTTPRDTNKDKKQVISGPNQPTTPHKVGSQSHTLAPLSPLSTSPSSPESIPIWDVRAWTLTLKGRCDGDVSSGSSKFNESWPSRTEQDAAGTNPLTSQQEQDVCVVKEVDVDGMIAEGNENSTESQSTLARYIERFRHAPPTSRNSRNSLEKPFWWKEMASVSQGDQQDTHPQGTSTPNTSSSKVHSFTDPSPRVSSGEDGLDSRSQDLLERTSDLLTSANDSLPAQKYLNTLRFAPEPKPLHTNQQPRDLSLKPSEDILVQWRLRRKLEQARLESATLTHQTRFYHHHHSSSVCRQHCPSSSGYVCHCQNTATRGGSGGELVDQSCQTMPEARYKMSTTLLLTGKGHHSEVNSPLLHHQSKPSPSPFNDMPSHEDQASSSKAPPRTLPTSERQDVTPTTHDHQACVAPPTSKDPVLLPTHTAKDHICTTPPTSQDHRVSSIPSPGGHVFTATPTSGDHDSTPTHVCTALPTFHQTPPTTAHRVKPTHGGLALRDTSLHGDEEGEEGESQLLITFTSEVESPSTSPTPIPTPSIRQTHIHCTRVVSSPVRKLNEQEYPLSPPTPPSSSHQSTSSKYPPQNQPCPETIETGIPWDCDMDDELLKLLITKARLFEAQIGEIDCRLMALQDQGQ